MDAWYIRRLRRRAPSLLDMDDSQLRKWLAEQGDDLTHTELLEISARILALRYKTPSYERD